jgi:beta-glucosidase
MMKRLGIVHVDFTTQTRTPKASAAFYREVAATNGRAALA